MTIEAINELKKWKLNDEFNCNSAHLIEYLSDEEINPKNRNVIRVYLKNFIDAIEKNEKEETEDYLTSNNMSATKRDFHNDLLFHPGWQDIGIEADEEWRKLPFEETKGFRTSQEKITKTKRLAKGVGIVGMAVPMGVIATYGIMQLIDQIKKLEDSDFQLKSLQDFHEYVASHANSIKYGAEIYGGVIGGILFILLLKVVINQQWSKYKYTDPIGAARLESSVDNFCKAIF